VVERRGTYRISVGKPEGKRLLGRPRHRWESNVGKDHKEIGWLAWTGLMWLKIGQLVSSCEHGNETFIP
jgi:hypothetical protein